MMRAESVIKPLRPSGPGWVRWPIPPALVRDGYPCARWYHEERGLQVISAVEVAIDRDGSSNGPEYHISVSFLTPQMMRPERCSSDDAKWMLQQFGLDGAEEDNHGQHAITRNFWRPVAEPLVGKECACKADEPAIVLDKGDYIWRP